MRKAFFVLGVAALAGTTLAWLTHANRCNGEKPYASDQEKIEIVFVPLW